MGAALVLFFIGFGLLAAGVLVGRYYVPDDRQLKRTARQSRSYMHAINLLLARDVDGAVNELRKVVDENVEDVEPYFALGALFRSRGEWERAVRVHQSIELRANINKRERLRAVYELGLDFRAAGMPRRATKAMEQCLDDDNKHEGALRALCGLYEEQRRFAEAADAWARLEKLRTGEQSEREPHLWAAAARQAVEHGELDTAKRYLKRAERIAGDSPHVSAAAAELAAAKGHPRSASKRLKAALIAAPALAPYFVPALEEAERQQVLTDAAIDVAAVDEARLDEVDRLVGERTGRILDEVIEQVGSQPSLQMARARVRSRTDLEGALAELRLALVKDRNLLPARVAAARLVLATGDQAAAVKELASLMAPDGALARLTEGVWQCDGCNRIETAFFWRCEQCRQWGSATFYDDRTRTTSVGQPRERRARARGRVGQASVQLPGPARHGAESIADGEGGRSQPGLLGRAGTWISGAWSGMRGGKQKRLPPPDDRPSE